MDRGSRSRSSAAIVLEPGALLLIGDEYRSDRANPRDESAGAKSKPAARAIGGPRWFGNRGDLRRRPRWHSSGSITPRRQPRRGGGFPGDRDASVPRCDGGPTLRLPRRLQRSNAAVVSARAVSPLGISDSPRREWRTLRPAQRPMAVSLLLSRAARSRARGALVPLRTDEHGHRYPGSAPCATFIAGAPLRVGRKTTFGSRTPSRNSTTDARPRRSSCASPSRSSAIAALALARVGLHDMTARTPCDRCKRAAELIDISCCKCRVHPRPRWSIGSARCS